MWSGNTDFSNDILHFLLHLLLGAQEALPKVITDTSTLKQHRQSLLLATEGKNTTDIFFRATEESSLNDGLGDGGGLFFLCGGVKV